MPDSRSRSHERRHRGRSHQQELPDRLIDDSGDESESGASETVPEATAPPEFQWLSTQLTNQTKMIKKEMKSRFDKSNKKIQAVGSQVQALQTLRHSALLPALKSRAASR